MKSKTGEQTCMADAVKDIFLFYEALGFSTLPLSREKTGGNLSPAGKGKCLTQDEKELCLKELRDEIGDCRRCRLSAKRTNIVFGEGNPGARLMFIGEAPGREEDLQGRPFVGDAGKVLTRLIEKMGFRRDEVYIANIVKCRPPLNRDPEMDEIEICRSFLEEQIGIIQPQVIMSLGRIPALALTGIPKLRITALRGKIFDFQGIPVMPTFHPAYLMRNPKEKWLTWNDAQKVLEMLSMKGER